MRILHIAPYHQPNMGYQENYLPAAQKRLGHEVALIASDRYHAHPNYKETMGWEDDRRIVGPGRYAEDHIEIIRLDTTWEWPAHWWVYLPSLWKEIKAFDPDMIHVHCINGLLSYHVLLGNIFRKRNLIVDDHNNYFNKVPYTWKKRVFYFLMRHFILPLSLPSVKRVLAMSHEVREYLHHDLGVPRDFITLNHLGADPGEFRRDPALGLDVRREYGIPEDAVVIVNSGKITDVKDNHILLEAMARVVKQDPRAYLIMIGNAPKAYRDRLKAIIDGHRLAEHVRWISFLPHDRLTAHYSAADIGCWPGDWSCTVIEAASCGVALVQPDLLYTKYSSANGNSLHFERGNVTDLAEKLATLVSDDARRAEMGRRSRELIENELNWDNIARQTIDIYERAITGKPIPPEYRGTASVQAAG